jgi:hypothetical protein
MVEMGDRKSVEWWMKWVIEEKAVVSLESTDLIGSTYDVQSNDLSASLLDLLQLSEVVPVSGLGDNVVGGKDPHSAVPLDSISFAIMSSSTH